MAEKKPLIVIKKITVVAGGAHGGAWKVAFADFMTAMMAFFLVMWLLAQSSEATKKNVADYFSTPSVIEYNFSNFGVELTLEKFFLDFINEPLKTLMTFVTPSDHSPNLMSMGMKKVVMSYLADQLGDIAEDVEISSDTVTFEIPETFLFERGTAVPAAQFVMVMEKLKGVVAGLEDTDMTVTSMVYTDSVRDADPKLAKNVSQQRVDLLARKIETSFESESVDLYTNANTRTPGRGGTKGAGHVGWIRFEMKQKKVLSDGRKPRPLADDLFGSKDADKSVYENFVKQVSEKRSRTKR
jgi:chemotaxis protein MotB